MDYNLLVISKITTDRDRELLVASFYPSATVSIKPRDYERISACYIHTLNPPLELAEAVSEKGKKRIKLLLKPPNRTEDERRAAGSAFYERMFDKNCADAEITKGISDFLYEAMCDLYAADHTDGDKWVSAAEDAVRALLDACQRQKQALKA